MSVVVCRTASVVAVGQCQLLLYDSVSCCYLESGINGGGGIITNGFIIISGMRKLYDCVSCCCRTVSVVAVGQCQLLL